MKIHKIDLTDPSGKGECVEIETPAGTVYVRTGVLNRATEKPMVQIETDEAYGWITTVRHDGLLGRSEISQTKNN